MYKIFILLLFLIIYLYCIRKTESYKQHSIIWLYWQNKPGKTMPTYIRLCLDTIYKNCKDEFKIVLLNEKTIYNYLPNLRKDLNKLEIAQKADYIRIKLLYKYGGIWLDTDTIVMTSLLPVIQKLESYDFVGFGCTSIYCNNGYPRPSNGFLAARKNSILMKNVLIELDKKLDQKNSDYNYYDLGKKVIWKEINKLRKKNNYKYYHYGSEYDGTRLKNKRWVRPTYYFNKTNELMDENKLFVIFLSNHDIIDCEKNRQLYDNFLKLSKNEILQQDYWISKMFRKAFNDTF